jgi:hypothetical protein
MSHGLLFRLTTLPLASPTLSLFAQSRSVQIKAAQQPVPVFLSELPSLLPSEKVAIQIHSRRPFQVSATHKIRIGDGAWSRTAAHAPGESDTHETHGRCRQTRGSRQRESWAAAFGAKRGVSETDPDAPNED